MTTPKLSPADRAQLRERAGWQPAETAPKDGRKFLAWDPRAGLLWTMHWSDKYNTFMPWSERWSGLFTHWMDHPEPPAAEDPSR